MLVQDRGKDEDLTEYIDQERVKIRTETYNRGFSTTYEYTRKYNANGRRKGGLAMKKIKAMAVGNKKSWKRIGEREKEDIK